MIREAEELEVGGGEGAEQGLWVQRQPASLCRLKHTLFSTGMSEQKGRGQGFSHRELYFKPCCKQNKDHHIM